jgi:hypothetical protein
MGQLMPYMHQTQYFFFNWNLVDEYVTHNVMVNLYHRTSQYCAKKIEAPNNGIISFFHSKVSLVLINHNRISHIAKSELDRANWGENQPEPLGK